MASAAEIRKKYLTRKEVNHIISRSALASIQPFLEDILIKSRAMSSTPEEFFELQLRITDKIIDCEKNIAALKPMAIREPRNKEWTLREIYKAHDRMLKSVADGVALRHFQFQRPILRELAQHNQTGNVMSKGFPEEVKQAARIVSETGDRVILNDLTNFLRYGDLTIISEDGGISIKEVKTTGLPRGKQKKELDALIKAINAGILGTGERTADYIRLPGRPSNFSRQVESIIEKSMDVNQGVYSEKVCPYLWVASTYAPQAIKYFKKTGSIPVNAPMPFLKEDIFSWADSLMLFGDFSPNTMPYSVFPFSENLISRIMIGEILIKAVVSRKELIKSLKGKGWDLIPAPTEPLKALYRRDDIDEIKDATVNPL